MDVPLELFDYPGYQVVSFVLEIPLLTRSHEGVKGSTKSKHLCHRLMVKRTV